MVSQIKGNQQHTLIQLSVSTVVLREEEVSQNYVEQCLPKAKDNAQDKGTSEGQIH